MRKRVKNYFNWNLIKVVVEIILILFLFGLSCIVFSTIDWTKMSNDDKLKIIGMISALVAFYFGLKQYQKGQLWKKTEFFTTQYKDFIANRYVQRVMLLLDYPTSNFQLFDDEIVSSSNKFQFWESHPNKKIVLESNYDIVRMSLSEQYDEQGDDTANIIRFSCDKFLFKLGLFENYISGKLMETKDVRCSFEYWINLLSYPYSKALVEHQYQFMMLKKELVRFIKKYEYKSLVALLSNLGSDFNSIDSYHYDFTKIDAAIIVGISQKGEGVLTKNESDTFYEYYKKLKGITRESEAVDESLDKNEFKEKLNKYMSAPDSGIFKFIYEDDKHKLHLKDLNVKKRID